MDRSMDSIGSCSLDADADSSDISDNSSLSFPTPISVHDITREFTANIRERCSIRTIQNSTAFVDPVAGQVRMVLSQPKISAKDSNALLNITVDAQVDKKPSYLNLACCVNGYSNLTTYDSKIRQDINKSREVSPIRPSSSSIQYCKKNNSLAPPVLLTMPNISIKTPNTKKPSHVPEHVTAEANNNTLHGNSKSSFVDHNDATPEEHRSSSFIQQRVERLYGPGALAQGFYSPKKTHGNYSIRTINSNHETDNSVDTELMRKFQQLSPSKDFSHFRNKLSTSAISSARYVDSSHIDSSEKNNIDLPVFRHLSQEFRAQLPIISPKKNISRNSPSADTTVKPSNSVAKTVDIVVSKTVVSKSLTDEVDHKAVYVDPSTPIRLGDISKQESSDSVSANDELVHKPTPYTVVQNQHQQLSLDKDGNHFLNLLKIEEIRILSLARDAEKYIDILSNNPEITEDTMGFLRAAAGKANLLVRQKMKQFEGLCHNNLNRSPEEKFPTTADDLQGFWDMVHLQIDHINSIFTEIEELKKNDWKKPKDENLSNIPSKEPNRSNIPSKQPKLANSTTNTKTRTTTSNGHSSKTNNAMSASALKRESMRKQLVEMKRKNRIAMATNSATSEHVESKEIGPNAIEIFVTANDS